jgi:uncharacterized protein YecE (DUF72 family)
MGSIHIGIGGWDYDPWRETYYPAGLARAKQLEHVGKTLSATEINATYYRTQRPELFARWAKAVPDGFRFALKASRFCTNRRALGEAAESIDKFCGQGFTELGDRLGPILWQLAPTKGYDPQEIAAFLALLPGSRDGIALRHAIEPRHESFRDPAFVRQARGAGVAIVCADHETYPEIADATAGFVYARLQRTRADETAGYAPAELDRWAGVIRDWATGGSPAGLAYADATPPPAAAGREVFAFVISGAKERNPAAAMALIERTGA